MTKTIEYANNYTDLSTERGFQFECNCNHCGNSYRTEFKASATNAVSNVLDAASSLFGGMFSQASNIGDRIHSAAWQKSRDEEFDKAIEELKPNFIQCPKCNSLVCRKQCWNQGKGLCKSCAPDLGVEMAAAQAGKSVEEIYAHAAMAEEDKKLGTEVWREGIKASCPKCEAPLSANVKFCPNCGADVKAKSNCPKCQAILTPGAKFCPECGEKM